MVYNEHVEEKINLTNSCNTCNKFSLRQSYIENCATYVFNILTYVFIILYVCIAFGGISIIISNTFKSCTTRWYLYISTNF